MHIERLFLGSDGGGGGQQGAEGEQGESKRVLAVCTYQAVNNQDSRIIATPIGIPRLRWLPSYIGKCSQAGAKATTMMKL